MSEYINKMTNNNQTKKNTTEKNIPFQLAQFINIYNSFTEKMNKSDFANSPRRYIVELGYIKQIKELALSNNIEKEAEKMIKKEQEIRTKLKEEFGIVIKD